MIARRLELIWLALVVITLVSWLTTSKDEVSAVAAAVAIGLAFLKAGMVGWDFMDLRRAPRWLAAAFAAWVVVFGVLLLVLTLV